jgi:small-conductance mechanosensitive channel
VLDNFADSALHFTAYFWLELNSVRDNRLLVSEMRFRIIDLFDEHGIVIPFPQQDVHIEAADPVPVRLVEQPPFHKDKKADEPNV